MSTEIHIDFNQRRTADGLANILEIHHPTMRHRLAGTTKIEFVHVSKLTLSEPIVLDGYLFGVMLFAMGGAERLHIKGPISAKALRNAQLLAEAWHSWLPQDYKLLEIVPEKILQHRDLIELTQSRSDKAIAAYSGGLDSTFSILRHAQNRLGIGSINITDLVMVHGFDVSTQNQADFNELLERTRPFVDELNLNLHVVQTNIKEVLAHNWEHVFGAQLACILHQFSNEFAQGVLASGSMMNQPDIHWGSSPQLDYLLSGGALEIVHDGAGKSRTDKAALIAQNPIARRCIKVCWEGAKKGRNCGLCEKCVRTRLNFMAAGNADPECFDTPFQLAMLDTLRTKNLTQLSLLKDITMDAKHNSTGGTWLPKLEQQIAQQERELTAPALETKKDESSPFLDRLYAHQNAITTLLKQLKPVWLLCDIPGNIGDLLIFAGTQRMLLKCGVDYHRLPRNDLLARIPSQSNHPQIRGTLLVPGSGACTRNWHEWLPDLIYSAASVFDRVVVLPSEYEPAVPVVRRFLSLNNVLPLAREVESYNKIKPFGRASLSLDPALWAFDFVKPETCHKNGSTLLALRTDSGSLLPEKRLRPGDYNHDISVNCNNLDEFIHRIQAVEKVVTDRLHVAVAGVMLGKQVHYVDPCCNKISRYIRYNFRDNFNEQLHQHNEQWLVDQGYAVKSEAMQ